MKPKKGRNSSELGSVSTAVLNSGKSSPEQRPVLDEDDVDEYRRKSKKEELLDQIADVPFEELERAKAYGGTITFSRNKKNLDSKRANKNRPVEVSSRKPVGRFRDVIQAPKRVIRDPRFESLCGKYDDDRFKSSYRFLFDEQLPEERKKLYALVETSDDKEVKNHVAWIDQQLMNEQKRRKRANKKQEQTAAVKQAVKDGKKAYYLKKSEVRRQELVEKYKELKSSGKLEKFMEKRRRKNAAKDHRYMPYRRGS